MREKPTRKRPYFMMEYAMTAILGDASGKMHHGIVLARRLFCPLAIPESGAHNMGLVSGKSLSMKHFRFS